MDDWDRRVYAFYHMALINRSAYPGGTVIMAWYERCGLHVMGRITSPLVRMYKLETPIYSLATILNGYRLCRRGLKS